jgi:hypothetical protein
VQNSLPVHRVILFINNGTKVSEREADNGNGGNGIEELDKRRMSREETTDVSERTGAEFLSFLIPRKEIGEI